MQLKPQKKIKSLEKLLKALRQARKKRLTVGFTNGCFDIIHAGHVKYLLKARTFCDILIVGVNTDSSVKKIKGPKRPVVGLRDRLLVMASLEMVDYVVSFKEATPAKLIKAIRPDFLIKGADWSKKDIVGAEFVKSYGGRVKRVPLVKGKSTTSLAEKIKKTK